LEFNFNLQISVNVWIVDEARASEEELKLAAELPSEVGSLQIRSSNMTSSIDTHSDETRGNVHNYAVNKFTCNVMSCEMLLVM
jgi:hypothetical protein